MYTFSMYLESDYWSGNLKFRVDLDSSKYSVYLQCYSAPGCLRVQYSVLENVCPW